MSQSGPHLMNTSEELFDIAKKLDAAGALADANDIGKPLRALSEAAHEIGRAFSGSWLGYHARVYYKDLAPPPAGAHFSQEWGLKDMSITSLGSRGAWREFQFDEIVDAVYHSAGNANLTAAKKAEQQAAAVFNAQKTEIVSILHAALDAKPDTFLSKLKDDIEELTVMSLMDVAQHWMPQGQIMTRDTLAIGQRNQVPPHIHVGAEVASLKHTFSMCCAAADIARKAASHLERKSRSKAVTERVGTNVFIGHGRSGAWRELKDFVQDRLRLPWDEFNRVPVAGVTNIARLSEMLEAAAIAFLVMTAEDEMADGGMQARMNVVHEAGLFQGRLGFTRAIVLLEEGCTEFSNIQGLGQIRFPKGKIGAAFEEVRRVMEREGREEASSAMSDEIISQGPGFTIYRTSDWGPAVPYRAAPREESVNHGFMDLRDHPELVAAIPEAAASPGLRQILHLLNEPGSPLMSIGCERRLNSRNDPRDEYKLYYHSYTDLTYRDPAKHAAECQLVQLANDFLHGVIGVADAVFAFELGIQRMRAFFGTQAGYVLSLGLSGYGRSEEEAGYSYEAGAQATANAFSKIIAT
jgi:predicted nucleotide-binding protein